MSTATTEAPVVLAIEPTVAEWSTDHNLCLRLVVNFGLTGRAHESRLTFVRSRWSRSVSSEGKAIGRWSPTTPGPSYRGCEYAWIWTMPEELDRGYDHRRPTESIKPTVVAALDALVLGHPTLSQLVHLWGYGGDETLEFT